MARGFPNFKKEATKCEACIIGKQNGDTFFTSTWQASICLKLIYSNICGLMETSFDGCKHFIIFVDDFIGMTWL